MGDLIDRQAAIDAVDATWWNARGIRKAIQELPSAQPERKKGKWIELDYTQAWEYKCDQCGRLSDFEENYCPNCGCAMEGEQDGNQP